MASLPTGTVVFLMSDIEGSTRLMGAVGDAFPQLLDEHHALMRKAVTTYGGSVVSTEGDSVFAVFPSARLATAAAVDAQRALATHGWPSGAQVHVRMGIHAGEAILGGGDYTGMDVHRTARIMAAAWGGQVLVSDAVRALATDALPDGVSLRDLGVHGLRDMPAPERLHQLVAAGMDADFPPPRTETVATPTNLPMPLTRFVGRERETAEIGELLQTERLVTLTGPGGTGKTRLSIEAARATLPRFPNGAWFVALDAVRDPSLVVSTVAQTMGVREQPGRTITDAVAERIGRGRVLLVLDNLEQVVAAGPDIVGLLTATDSACVLASSREPLAVGGEHVYLVAPLGIPPEPGMPTAEDIRHAPSIQLFVERASAVRRGFTLTDENAATVAAICRRLDGLPLAIELAAARLNLLTVDQVLERLDHRLTLLSGKRRDAPDRQQTLRGTIDWSHDLLSEPERVVFRRFSVFAGGADLDALGAVIDPKGDLGGDVIDIAGGLVDKSLLRTSDDGGKTRLTMLETIREYAGERLAEAGEAEDIAAGHADRFATVAQAAEGVVSDPRRDAILDRLDRDLGNIRAAIDWSLRSRRPDVGLLIATALNDFWHLRSHVTEATRLLVALVDAAAPQGETLLRARGLIVAGGLFTWIAEGEQAVRLAAEGMAMAERLGDDYGVALGKSGVGWGLFFTAPGEALPVFEAGVEAARRAGAGVIEMEHVIGQAWTHVWLRHLDEADALARHAIDRGRDVGAQHIVGFAHMTRGIIHALRGDEVAAVREYADGLRHAQQARAAVAISFGLDCFAAHAVAHGDPVRATRLAAAAARLREETGGGASLAAIGLNEPLEQAKSAMDRSAFESAVAAGRAMIIDDAVALALEDVSTSEAPPERSTSPPSAAPG